MLKLSCSDDMPETLLNITCVDSVNSQVGLRHLYFHFSLIFYRGETEAYQALDRSWFKQRWFSWTPRLLSISMCCPAQGSVRDSAESKVAAKMPSEVRVSTHVPPSDHTRQSVACCGYQPCGFIRGTGVWGSGSVSEWGNLNLTFKVKQYSNGREGVG